MRQRLQLRAKYEFKFSRTHRARILRAEFFGTALAQDFRFAVSVIDKRQSYWASSGRQEQLWAAATELAALLRRTYQQADEKRHFLFKEPVVIDDNRDHEFLAVVKRQFRGLLSDRPGLPPFVGSVRFRSSGPDEMLQLVDMVCGAAVAFLDGSDLVWYELIAERDVEGGRFPM